LANVSSAMRTQDSRKRIASFDAPDTWVGVAWPEIEAIPERAHTEAWARQPLGDDELAWILRSPKIVKSCSEWRYDKVRARLRFLRRMWVYTLSTMSGNPIARLYVSVTMNSYSISLFRKKRVAGVDTAQTRRRSPDRRLGPHFQVWCREDEQGRGHSRAVEIHNLPTGDPLKHIYSSLYAFSQAINLRFKRPLTAQSLHLLTKPIPAQRSQGSLHT